MCDALPAPTVATDALSGLALSQAISSFRSFAGRSFFPRIHSGEVVSTEIGSKSWSTWYGNR
jgi:hypothetical protein